MDQYAVVATGKLGAAFMVYGMFNNFEDASQWAHKELGNGPKDKRIRYEVTPYCTVTTVPVRVGRGLHVVTGR